MTTMGTETKAAGATRPFHVDIGPRLRTNELVASVPVFSASPVGLTIGAGAYTPTKDADSKGATVWLIGGTPGVSYEVSCTYTTNSTPAVVDTVSFIVVIEEPYVAVTQPFDGIIDLVRDFGLDPTGAAECSAQFNAANAAAPVGSTLYFRTGKYKFGSTSGAADMLNPLTAGVTVTGPSRGMRRGHRVDVPIDQAGALIQVYGTGRLFRSGDETTIENLEIESTFQNPNAVTPTVAGYWFDITSFGCTVRQITAINPYQLINVAVAGCTIDQVYGFPLFRGINLGVCNDVVRVSNVHLNPNLSDANPTYRAIGPNLKTYVAANAIAYLLDGAEGFQFSNCFAFGYTRGLHLGGGSGYFLGGGFDQSGGTAVMMAGAAGSGASTLSGITFHGTGFVPVVGGNCIQFADTHVPVTASERPSCTVIGGVFDAVAPGAGRGVVIPAASYGICRVIGSTFQHMANECGRNDSANAFLRFDQVINTPTSATRTAGAGAISDVNGLTLP